MKRQCFALVLLSLVAAPTWAAAACSATIEANDAMQFNQKSIEVPKSCKQFTVTLKHVGKLPKAAMGHNWVLSAAADEPGIDADGAKAGPGNDYLKPGDGRVIAHTRLIGGGESDSTTFKVAALKAGETYAFFCSFPGHAALMKGTLGLGK
ncbi:azurin [Frateuria sp. Soil773]|uniref:azurin n=1 Tax=Frateuria sp. Soil773 TaxID=1736407 RepID=UPI0006FD7489|nr:azurin [Frateuria sp. Soil773]KRF01805.1 azurin [Frateuria sp. Soil773]